MFISKKKFLELQKQADDYMDEMMKRLESEAKAEKKIIELYNKITDLQAELAERIVPNDKKKETVREISGKIGVFSNEEYSEPKGRYNVYFAKKVVIGREELGKAAIAAVRAAIESLEPEHRRYVVLEYVFENVMEQAIKFAEINL